MSRTLASLAAGSAGAPDAARVQARIQPRELAPGRRPVQARIQRREQAPGRS